METWARGLLGGVAGGFAAKEEVIDANMKDKREAAKQAAIEKRKRRLLELQNDYATTRQEAGWEQDKKVREDKREYQEGIIKDERTYQSQKEKDLFDMKQKGKKDILGYEYNRREDLERIKARYKGLSDPEKKRIEKNALLDTKAFLSSQGAVPGMDDDRQFILPLKGTTKKERDKERDEILKVLDSSGFRFNTTQKEKTLQINLASFDPDNIKETTKGYRKAGTEDKKDYIAQALKKKGLEKNTGSQSRKEKRANAQTTGRSESEQPGLAAPQEKSDITVNGKPVKFNSEQGYIILENGQWRPVTNWERKQISPGPGHQYSGRSTYPQNRKDVSKVLNKQTQGRQSTGSPTSILR